MKYILSLCFLVSVTCSAQFITNNMRFTADNKEIKYDSIDRRLMVLHSGVGNFTTLLPSNCIHADMTCWTIIDSIGKSGYVKSEIKFKTK